MIQITPQTFIQTPREVLDYAFDFTEWLQENEIISTNTITITPILPTPLTSVITPFPTFIKVVLSAGAVNTLYTVVCKITTNSSRTKESSFYLRVKEI